MVELNNQVMAVQRMRALRQARNGKVEAMVGELEVLLDGDIIGLSYDAENSITNKDAARNILRRVAIYRKECPHVPSDPEVAKAVEHALSLASQ